MGELKHRVEQEQSGDKSPSWLSFPNPFAKKTETAPKKSPSLQPESGPLLTPGATMGQPQGYPGPTLGAPATPYPQQPETAPAPRPAGQGTPVPGSYPQGVPGYGGAYSS